VLPKYRKTDDTQLHVLKTGRSYRPPQEWVWSDAPAIISPELFEKAHLQLQRNAEVARKMYQPTSRRYLLRTLVKCGECGLGMVAAHQRSVCKKYDYLYYECKGHAPLTCGRITKCAFRRVRADHLDAVVWNSLSELLCTPTLLPQLHQTWAQTKQHDLTTLTTQQAQMLQRRQRLERQNQRLVDAYQTETITLSELQLRRQKLTTELQHLDRELHQLTHVQQQTLHWQQVIDYVDHFRHLLGENLERLSFADRQTVAQCLIKKVVVTGEQVDISKVISENEYPASSCSGGAEENIPFGEKGIALQACFHCLHRGLAQCYPFCIDLATQFSHGLEPFPGHPFGPLQHRCRIAQLGAIPM
jgi:Recombinase zinc beta ribbon domain